MIIIDLIDSLSYKFYNLTLIFVIKDIYLNETSVLIFCNEMD